MATTSASSAQLPSPGAGTRTELGFFLVCAEHRGCRRWTILLPVRQPQRSLRPPAWVCTRVPRDGTGDRLPMDPKPAVHNLALESARIPRPGQSVPPVRPSLKFVERRLSARADVVGGRGGNLPLLSLRFPNASTPGHGFPALYPARAVLARIPFGPPALAPSPASRRIGSALVRRLQRLLWRGLTSHATPVHHRLWRLDFPMADHQHHPAAAGGQT